MTLTTHPHPAPRYSIQYTVQLYFYSRCKPSSPLLGWTLPFTSYIYPRHVPRNCIFIQLRKREKFDFIFQNWKEKKRIFTYSPALTQASPTLVPSQEIPPLSSQPSSFPAVQYRPIDTITNNTLAYTTVPYLISLPASKRTREWTFSFSHSRLRP